MLIQQARVFRENDFAVGDIAIADGVFAASSPDGEVVDGRGLYAIPGLIDLHFHGCVGEDFSDSDVDGMNRMMEHQAANGVTAICPATMTLAEEALAEACRRMAVCGSPEGAELVGINLEGPFLSPDRLGAQNPAFVRRPDVALFHRLQKAAGGRVKLLAVAPETEGAMEMIRKLRDEVGLSVAHTTAGYDLARKAFDLGARQVTHLYNAMPPLNHREPGVIGAAMDGEHVMVELICDGIHIHPAAVRAAFRMFGDRRVILISDSMRAAGLGDGSYDLGGLPVTVAGKVARLTHGGAIAGSVTGLLDCVRTAAGEMGISLHSAVRCATLNPAKALGIEESRGSIRPGRVADLVLLREDLSLHGVVLRGKLFNG